MNKNIEERIQAFKDFMRTPDGAPVVSPELVEWLVSNGFFHVPASHKYHGAYEGGLFEHSMAVASYLVGLTESCALHWKNPESPYIVGMFHDLCKCDQYRRCLDDPGKWEYSTDMLFKGHGEKSVMLLSQFCL